MPRLGSSTKKKDDRTGSISSTSSRTKVSDKKKNKKQLISSSSCTSKKKHSSSSSVVSTSSNKSTTKRTTGLFGNNSSSSIASRSSPSVVKGIKSPSNEDMTNETYFTPSIKQQQQQRQYQFQYSSDDRSVGINTPTPQRRPRPSPITQRSASTSSSSHHGRRASVSESQLLGVKKVIQELNKAIGDERRIAAITNACAEFDHWEVEQHDAELALGSANVLSLVLSMTDKDDEIRMICAALEMVYRASCERVKVSFSEVGNAVVPLLLRLLERCENGSLKHADVSIHNITKVLLYFSRVPELRVPLARHQGLLSALTRVATSILNPDCRILRMRVMANLANCDDNKVTMLEHSGLVESILKIATLDLSEAAREYAAASLMDLASCQLNQIPMARSDKLLGVCVKLAIVDCNDQTREYALTALQNLAFSKDNRTRLTTFGSGVVLEALKKALAKDSNDKSRRRAAGALTNLACDETSEAMGSHKGLMETLAQLSVHDISDDVQRRSCLAITKIAASCTVSMSCFSKVLKALVDASRGQNSSGIAAVFRVRARDVECREVMARHPGLLERLADIATNPKTATSKDRDNATRALLHLTNENKNRKLMCNSIILQALVEASTSEHVEMRDSAILALERLATEVSNRPIMSRQDGLIVAISRAVEREYQSELAGEKNTQARLAKPLLMSLLLSM